MIKNLAKDGTCSQIEQFLQKYSPIEQDDMANALAIVALRGDSSIVKILMDNGAKANIYPDEHLPPIHCAIEQQHIDIVRLLAEHGADVNFPTRNGFTPLHLSVDIEGDSAWQKGEIPSGEITALLLKLGANPTAVDANGKTPLDIAKQYQHARAIDLLTHSKK